MPIFSPTLSTVLGQHVLQWERQKTFSYCNCRGTLAKKCHSNIFLFFLIPFLWPIFFHSYEERREENGEKIKHEDNFQNCPFWTYIK